MKILLKKNRKTWKVFFFAACLFNGVYGQSQVMKLYASKEDYTEGRHELCEGVTLHAYSEEEQKLKHYGGFAFLSDDEIFQRRIARKIFLVEYNDSLYMNARLLKDFSQKGRFAVSGFVKVRDHNGKIYFEAMQKVNAKIAPAIMFGVIGAAVAENNRKKEAKSKPLLYYYYNSDTNLAALMTQEQLMEILKENDPDLYALYKREPNPERDEVIVLYARAFFEKKEGKVPDQKE